MRITRIFVCVATLSLLGHSAAAQGTGQTLPQRPTVGGTIHTPPATSPSFEASGNTEVLRHRDFTGKPCLAVNGTPRAHIADRNLYDHVITARNNCPQRIAMQVCYYQTHDCIRMEIPGSERKEAILGTLPSMKDFRFEFREKF
jgi:hypothetical protein